MPIKAAIIDGRGTGQLAGVTLQGELIVAGAGHNINISKFQSLTTTGAFNLFGPITGQQFIITSIVMDTVTTATVTLYEAANPTTTTVDKTLFQITLTTPGASTALLVLPLPFGGFLPVSEGEYLNVKTTSATVDVNVIGYYHPTQFNPP